MQIIIHTGYQGDNMVVIASAGSNNAITLVLTVM